MPNVFIPTKSYLVHKEHFIKQYNFQSQIISTVKRLERAAINFNTELQKPIESILLYEPTHIALVDYMSLACFYLYRPLRKEIAPCCLFFTGLHAKSDSSLAPYVEAVKKELNW